MQGLTQKFTLGLFDSGSGGLTVLSAMRKSMPGAAVMYFGDIDNAPYGERGAAELMQLTRDGVSFLQERGADLLVSACNSVSASVLAGAAGEMPFVEMSIPTAQYLLPRYYGKRLLLLATPATILSRLYQNALGDAVDIDPLPSPGLAGAIEQGSTEGEIETIVKSVIAQRHGGQYDAIVLGCTHYPLVTHIIQRVANNFFGAVDIIDPAYSVAAAVQQKYPNYAKGPLCFFISKPSRHFEHRVRHLFGDQEYMIEVIGETISPIRANYLHA